MIFIAFSSLLILGLIGIILILLKKIYIFKVPIDFNFVIVITLLLNLVIYFVLILLENEEIPNYLFQSLCKLEKTAVKFISVIKRFLIFIFSAFISVTLILSIFFIVSSWFNPLQVLDLIYILYFKFFNFYVFYNIPEKNFLICNKRITSNLWDCIKINHELLCDLYLTNKIGNCKNKTEIDKENNIFNMLIVYPYECKYWDKKNFKEHILLKLEDKNLRNFYKIKWKLTLDELKTICSERKKDN